MTADLEVWIKTAPTPDGSGYAVTLEVGKDTARILTPATAMHYAAGVLAATSRAQYDAAVLRQLTQKLAVTLEAATQMVVDMRADRPPLDPDLTDPLAFEPGVGSKLKPFLVIRMGEQVLGQWEIPEAREHALAVLDVIAVADLDSTYYRTLVGIVGIEGPTARQVIGDLANYRR